MIYNVRANVSTLSSLTTANATRGEGRRVGFLLNKQFAAKLLYHSTLAVVLYEGIVLLCRALGERLEPAATKVAMFEGVKKSPTPTLPRREGGFEYSNNKSFFRSLPYGGRFGGGEVPLLRTRRGWGC